MNRTRRRASIALLLALAPSASLAATQNITWTGGSTTSNWEDPSKWSPNVIPNNTGLTTYNVLIDNGALSAADVRFNTPEFGPEFYTVDSLTISSGDRLT